MLIFITIVSVSILICCAVFLVAQALALRKLTRPPEIAILPSKPDLSAHNEQSTRLSSATDRPAPIRTPRARTRPGKPPAKDLDQARTVLTPQRSKIRPFYNTDTETSSPPIKKDPS